ncbi:biotin--[acetyl-CoA-carboxylase] ligase, partial [Candidatus Bathyarchaeota archaeon]|nr:biotin--[acetyl-CoA-carboxylase] ligase [Candidatus Bathyarchaeota archaeon]
MSPQDAEKHQKIQQNVSGYKVYIYKSLSSTNKIAKEVAEKTDEEKIVILAETQTMGRGRLGRQWISPKGGLWLSVILRPQTSPKEALRLTFIMSSAVAKTIKTLFNLETSVKWPNDVLVNGKKISGILTEINTRESLVTFVIVGVGINVNIDLESFPSSLRATVTSLKHELG